MKSLSELRIVLGGLQDQVNECVDYIDQLNGLMWGGKGPKRKYAVPRSYKSIHKGVNGEAPQLPSTLRERVKEHYHQQRGAVGPLGGARSKDFLPSPPTARNITIEEAAHILKMSDNGVRFRINRGQLPSTTEVRQTRTSGIGAKPHKVIVVDRAAVLALADAEAGGALIRGRAAFVPARKPAKKTRRAAKPARAKKSGPGHASKIQQQRQRTVDLLAKFNPDTPFYDPASARLLGPLVRRGYLRKVGERQYLRTGLEFSVKPTKKTSGGRKKR
jgi:hypothetical protein